MKRKPYSVPSTRLSTTLVMMAWMFHTSLAVASPASIGTYSGCKKLKGSAAKACKACVEGGNFYQTKSKTCGMAEGMKRSKRAAVDAAPPKPKKMPATASSYARVPAGSFVIGAASGEEGRTDFEGQAKVEITRPFMMKTTEVTQDEWYFVMGTLSTTYEKSCGGSCPVGRVSWRDALNYLNRLSKLEKLKPCYDLSKEASAWVGGLDCEGYRLPTEAEWEYAARAGSEDPRYGEVTEIGWSSDNSDMKPRPVGKKAANAFGLYDMLGGVWEWVWDAYDWTPFTGSMTDPIIGGLSYTAEQDQRSVRGGSYRNNKFSMRAAHRHKYYASSGDLDYGFRPVRTSKK